MTGWKPKRKIVNLINIMLIRYNYLSIFLVLMAVIISHGVSYGQEGTPERATRAKVVTFTKGYYQGDVGVRAVAEDRSVTSTGEGLTFEHHLSVDVSHLYDDNVYNSEDNEIDDFVTIVSPQVRLDFITEKLFVDTSYKMDVAYYPEPSYKTFGHALGIQATYSYSPRLSFYFTDKYKKTSTVKEISGTDIESIGGVVNKTDQNEFTIRGEYDFIRGGNKIWTEYNNLTKGVAYHGRANTLSSNRQDVALGFTHSFTRRTSVSPGIKLTRYRNRKSIISNLDGYALTLGFDHDFMNILKGFGEFGLDYRDHKKRGKWELVPTVDLGLKSIYSGRSTINLDWTFDKKPSYVSATEYNQHELGAGLSYLLTRLLRASTSGVYTVREYTDAKEQELIRYDLSLNYKLGAKLATILSYKFYKVGSTNAADEYTDNVYMLTVKTTMW